MRDHNYITEDGTLIPVSKLPTEQIQTLLVEGIEIHNADGDMPEPENVMERMRIELLIRELKL